MDKPKDGRMKGWKDGQMNGLCMPGYKYGSDLCNFYSKLDFFDFFLIKKHFF